MGINPGRYNVFNEDGTLFKWGADPVSATVTMKNRVQVLIGDNMEPTVEKHIPARIQTVNDFDKFTLSVCRGELVKYAALLTEKLCHFMDAQQHIIQSREANNAAMLMGFIPVWRWIEKTMEINELQQVCENLLEETLNKLYDVAPQVISEHIMIFTEG